MPGNRLHQRKVIVDRICTRAHVIGALEQLWIKRVKAHKLGDPYLSRGRWCATLNFFTRHDDIQTRLSRKGLPGFVQRDRFSRFRIDHPLLNAPSIALVQQMKVNLTIFQRGVEFDGDLVLLNRQHSLPH